MISWITINITASLIMMLITSSSPLTSSLIILSMALTIASLYSTLLSSWYAFLVFLIYIGGMLVMFAYFVALSPNQNILLSPLSQAPIILLPLFTLHLNSPLLPFYTPLYSTLFSQSNSTTLISLALLLLLTMVVIVKITNITKGPLRAF